MFATTQTAPFLLRLAVPFAWRTPERIAAKLRGFSATELGSARDMMRAAEQTDDGHLRRLFFKHAIDEHRHSKMFAEAAAKAANGVNTRRYEALHAAPQDLLERWGLVRFIAFVYISETRAARQFTALQDHFGGTELGRLFETIGKDETFHVAYSKNLLETWAAESPARALEIKRAKSSVKRSLLWMAWRRSGHRIGNIMVMGLMGLLYGLCIPLFAGIQRIADRNKGTSGWHLPAPEPTASRDESRDPNTIENARRPF